MKFKCKRFLNQKEVSSNDVIANDASATSAQWRVLRLVPRDDNAIGANAKWEVIINEHQFTNGSVGL